MNFIKSLWFAVNAFSKEYYLQPHPIKVPLLFHSIFSPKFLHFFPTHTRNVAAMNLQDKTEKTKIYITNM